MDKQGNIITAVLILLLTGGMDSSGQTLTDSSGQLKFSSFDTWYYRTLTESALLGGETKHLYEIGVLNPLSEQEKLHGKDPDSPWGTSNFMVKMGFNKAVNSVFPDTTKEGYCCRLETKLFGVNTLGLKVNVLVAGCLFVGEMIEPVRNIREPLKKMNHGIPFTGKPKAIRFDYRYHPGENRIKSVYTSSPVEGSDKAEFCLILQKRWEDEKGRIWAIRIGGIRTVLSGTAGKWARDTTFAIHYGIITREPFYHPETMGLIPEVSEMYVKNSKDQLVMLTETAWGKEEDNPTHLVLYFTSSYQGVDFTGSPESTLWIDNVCLIY
jgi:hypothetical protein